MKTRPLTRNEVVDGLSAIFHAIYPELEYDFSEMRHPLDPGLIVRHTVEGSEYIGEFKISATTADIFKLASVIVSDYQDIMYDGEGPKRKFINYSF